MMFHRCWDPFKPRHPIACYGTGLEIAAFASLALGAASTGMSMIGQSQQAQAQAGMMNYQSQIARNNQILMQRNADIARQQGDVQAQQLQQKTAQIKGAQRAALAAQGGDVNQGSPLDIVADTERAGQTDVATTRYNAAMRAYGFESEAAGAGASASAYSAGATNVMGALPYGMGSSLLGGLASGAKWYSAWKGNPGGRASGGDYLDYGGVAGPAW